MHCGALIRLSFSVVRHLPRVTSRFLTKNTRNFESSNLPGPTVHNNDSLMDHSSFDLSAEEDKQNFDILAPDSGKHFDLSTYAPELAPTFNFAAYANKSPTIQKLVQLGVDVAKFENRKGITKFVLGLDFERDMKQHIQFLHDVGVPPEKLGWFLTKNPLIFKEDLEQLAARIEYLNTSGYSPGMIARVVTGNPYWLMFSVDRIENRLKFLKEHFEEMSPSFWQKIVCQMPRLITYSVHHIKEQSFSIREEMGFNQVEVKRILVNAPKLWMIHNKSLVERFNVVHDEMGVSHWQLSHQAQVLLCRATRLRQRHLFLKHVGRAQYDQREACYVPIFDLAVGTDAAFAVNVAHSSMAAFSDFLKTL